MSTTGLESSTSTARVGRCFSFLFFSFNQKLKWVEFACSTGPRIIHHQKKYGKAAEQSNHPVPTRRKKNIPWPDQFWYRHPTIASPPAIEISPPIKINPPCSLPLFFLFDPTITSLRQKKKNHQNNGRLPKR